jgi:hypothetical protein
LDALAEDPNDLAADLRNPAGLAAGPAGGQVLVDSFSGGALPSKDAIREIRIKQDPFSPEYEKLGRGRAEVVTKPGTDKLVVPSSTTSRVTRGIPGTHTPPKRRRSFCVRREEMQARQAGATDLGGGGFSEAANNGRLELQVRFSF